MDGKLIVFEGIEGGGKTTQIQQTCDWLQKHLGSSAPAILTTKEPGGTALGRSLRKILLDSRLEEPIASQAELLLFAADRAQHVETFLKPHLEQGAIILCDRFTDSTIAYQGYGRGLDQDLIVQLNQIATGGLQSDLTLWFDLEVEKGLARTQTRGEMDRMEQADLAFHQRVNQGFCELASQAGDRIIRIDAHLSLEQVSEKIQRVLSEHLKQWGFLLKS
ncbi:dTMP kinase [Limnoraphis robusta]|uniref:Thymidylate kinase n=1 Tax=Limnoraphis robusta CS-951 TaxID=1637645 RepID=A0A0F5YBR2_9CYAN|nr:dTMP kinase [Limnoraphis robusta]KKD36188.1 thymidylate kinase [Limnoraphis robusta CS-951]KMW70522.1 thymidylate kinase [Limnoraphis robusta CS-951]